ncbi:MAG TPA: class IV adenylate cyclase [Terriglobales bacterium]|nr:class IV adenylate cyclase [Terriglobales bacterium]
MSSKKEVEIKFRITNLRELTARLRAAGFRRVTPRTHEMNTLYDLPGQQLRKRGELLRLRKYGSDWLLTHKAKGAAGRHKTRVETQTAVENGGKMEGILRALGFQAAFRYEKFRSEWSDGSGHVVLDHTPIGDYGEIEGAPRWIDQVANKLGIERRDYITKTYAELFAHWKSQMGTQAKEMTFKAVGKPRPK